MPPILCVDQFGNTDKHDVEGVQYLFTGFEEYGRALGSENKEIARINFFKASQLLGHYSFSPPPPSPLPPPPYKISSALAP